MFQNDKNELILDYYVANVRNRLQDIITPDEDTQKRWIWELIQNAKDCSKEARSFITNPEKLPFKRARQSVDIKIIFDESKKIVIFKHNGFPFTARTLDSLMYKYSTKISDDDKTGRFGTGFMTTHTLSRVVPIHAPFLTEEDQKWKLYYIEAIIYREDDTDRQLREDYYKMENSKKAFEYDPKNEEHKWTTFTYELKEENNFKSAKLGIQSFRENIMEVLLFCDEINSIQINDEAPIFSSAVSSGRNLTQSIIKQNVFHNIQITEKNVVYNNERKFIVATVEEPNEAFSKKMAEDNGKDYKLKNLKLTIAFETDFNNKLVQKDINKICLFCTFPLIASEKYQLPFLLHSPYLETFSERNGISLDGNHYKPNGILSKTGLNFIILNYSIELFKIVLQMLIQNNFTNLSVFSNGLIYNAETLKTMIPFLDQFRTIMCESNIIHNSKGDRAKLKETTILDFDGVKDPKTFHELASQLYKNVASFEECNEWQHKTWEKISVLNLDTFVNHINHIGQNIQFKPTDTFCCYALSNDFFSSLSSLEKQDFAFLNKLYQFLLIEESENPNRIEVKDNSIFYKYKIILNSDNNFTILRGLKSNIECSKDFNKVMELCKKWNSKIINPHITVFKDIIPKITINDALQEINFILENDQDNLEFLLNFVQFTINENENRRKMYEVAKLFYDIPPEIVLSDVDERLWSTVDLFLIRKINDIINRQKGKKFTKSLTVLNFFYELYQKYNSNTNFLVPNYNLIYTEKRKLGSISNEIDSVLLDTLGPFIDLSQYAHPSITTVAFKKCYDLNQLIITINKDEFFQKKEVFMDVRLFSVLSIMPPKSNQRLYNYQTNIRELAQLFFCSEIKLIPTSIVNELFWKRANEIVLDAIEHNLDQTQSMQNLTEILMKDEETVFNNLNMYYEILSTEESNRQNKAMVPNYKGSFLPAKNISLSKGVSEELFDLYNVIQSDSDVREKYAHPNVICNFLNIIDFKQFISSICEGLSDDQLVNDYKILQAISNLNIKNNSNSNENEILLQKLYTANIKNRLSEIQNPSENDEMRWPWELIQNSKDSLYSPSNVKKQKRVEIFIGVKTDEQTDECTEINFSHTGPPFTDNSFIGLLYKISQEKDNPETTGRFGTGFVSTHVLSKVVQIQGNRIDKDGKIYGFEATMYREGTKEPDIINDFKEMQKSQKTFPKPFPNTKFTYKINSEQSRKCVKLGLDHLKNHISLALINCPEIKYIVINENGFQTKYYASEPKKKKIGSITYYLHEVYKDTSVYQRFIVLFDKEQKLSIAVEIDDHGAIIPIGDNIENVFVAFPLVGSFSFHLPFYLNSPNLEPSTERNALILDGEEQINGTPTNTGKNRFLLMKSTELYGKLILVLNEKQCPNMYELSRGLLLSNQPYVRFDVDWYKNNFLKVMREILSSNLKVTTERGENVLLKDAYFPFKEINNEILQQFIKLTSRYCRYLVSTDDAIIWKDKVWEQLNIVEIEGLVIEVGADQHLFDDNDFSYLNEVLGFVWNMDMNIFYEYYLIPDMNNELHCLSKDKEKFNIRESKTVKGQIIDIMESIDIKWRSTHMNHNIDSISLSEDKLIDAESRIKEKLKEDNSMCFELVKFVLENDEFRQNMFYFVTKLNFRDYSPITVNDVNPEIWNFADDFVLNEIVKKISDFPPDEVESLMEFFIRFLPVYKSYIKDEKVFNSGKIIPNARYNLCKLSDLKNKKDNFHDHLNPIMIKHFGKDLDEVIVHPEINTIIRAKDDESLADLFLHINRKIKEFTIEVQLEIAERVISLVPAKEDKNHENKQKQIFSLYHDLINHEIEEVPINRILFLDIYWRDSNEIIIEQICSKIQESENLANFKETFSITEDDQCFEILNQLYQLSRLYLDKYKIIPNRKGIFKLKKELKEDPGIQDDLLECISILKPESIGKYELADSRVNIKDLDRIAIFDFYEDLIAMFTEALVKPDVDENIVDMLKRITHVNDPSFFDTIASKEMSEDQKARMRILQNAHVQFISNRLRELNSASTKDFKRWPFELIQNANDSLFSTLNDNDDEPQRKVQIQFNFEDDKVTFSHNGPPFTNNSLFALLYQCSEGKYKDARSTGKFGTGFMSTLVLSRVVNFSGDVQTNDGIMGFDVMIYRDGLDNKELEQGVSKMEESLKKHQERKNLTTFEYILPKIKNSKVAYDEGLKSLRSDVGPVLIYNPTIESITIKTTKETYVYRANHEEGNLQTISVTTTDAKQQRLTNKIMKFVMFNSNQKYNESKDVFINCLLQIDDNNEIPFKMNPDVLFISYPLFDSNQFRSPILINSPSLEPERERNNIIIQSVPKKTEEEDEFNESDESLINKFILTNTIDLFKQILSFVLDMNCTKLYNLALGLRYGSKNEFLQENFYQKMREVLLSFPVFETASGLKKSEEVLMPSINSYDIFNDYDKNDEKLNDKKKQHYADFYRLVYQLSIDDKYVVSYKSCKEWQSNSWVSFPSQISIKEFIEFISKHEKVSDLKVIDTSEMDDELFITQNVSIRSNENDNNDIDSISVSTDSTSLNCSSAIVGPESNFIKNVIVFIEQLRDCDAIFKENNILINGKGRFVSSKEIHCFDLPDFIIEMFEIINYDYKEKTLHNEIKHLYKNKNITFEKFEQKEALGIIKEAIDENNAINFMKYLIKRNERRASMFEYTKFLIDNSIESVELPDQKDQSITNEILSMLIQADNFVIIQLIKKIRALDLQQNIVFFTRFFRFLRGCLSADHFDSLHIYPNQRYQLCASSQLRIDQINDEDVKNVLENVLEIDLKSQLLLNDFVNLPVAPLTRNSISRDVSRSSNFARLLSMSEEDRFGLYKIIFKYSEENENLHLIMSALNFFLNVEMVDIDESEDKWTSELTNQVIQIAASEITNFVSQYHTIYELKENIRKERKGNDFINLIYENLSNLYNFTKVGGIFPNQIKQLVEFTEINWLHDQQVNTEVLNQLLNFMIQFSNSDEIKQHILSDEINVCDKLKEEINIYDLDYIAENILNLIQNSPNKDTMEFDRLKISFIKFINSSNQLKIRFSSLIKNEMDDRMDDFLKFLENSEADIETGFRGEALAYEMLINSGKFSKVEWMAKSEDPTNFSITLDNDNTYYIKESGKHYDIFAESSDGNQYYFEVKSTKSNDDDDKKFRFMLSRAQFEMASELSDSNEFFVLVLVKDVYGSPEFLFLTKQNELFTM